jgi:chemotaxis protein methyltransferase CheR
MFNFFKKKKVPVYIEPIKEIEDYEDIMPIANYFHKETGIIFDKQVSILKNKVISFCRQRNIYSFKKLLLDIESIKHLKQELVDHLTTNETYFYREVKQIMELVELVKESHTSIQILCAPSSTGEEPYSIAIALLEAGIPMNRFNIVGIDINSEAISKGEEAAYGQRNVRHLSDEIISKYFKKQNEKYLLTQNIKSLVSFKVVNIFDESLKSIGKFDFIFSRNMLIYFDKETKLKAKKILESLRKTDEHSIFFGHADLF